MDSITSQRTRIRTRTRIQYSSYLYEFSEGGFLPALDLRDHHENVNTFRRHMQSLAQEHQ